MAKKTVQTVTDYLDTAYREYAVYVVENRAIPSVIDGFKPTQRKVVFVADRVWKNGSEKNLKIFQLAGKVASDAHYHHGDSSLSGAIIGMAQKFKNSMPVLDEIGQFGSLRSPEAGAPRYISTRLHPNFRLLYKDFELLSPRYEEGNEIEPQYFLPIIPTVLLNGGSGIAVGFATNILNRNPLELIDACIKSLEGKKFKEPQPWFNGFSGTCERVDDSNSWIFRGLYEIKNTSTIQILELPPSMTYEKYDAYLNGLEETRRITEYDNNCKSDVNYLIKMRREEIKSLQTTDKLTKFLKMEEKESENFTVLDENGALKIFESATDIINYFVNFRLGYYSKRKEYLIAKIESELLNLSNRARFIKEIIEGTLKVNNVARNVIEEQLEKRKFDKISDSYSYLLSMPIHTLTKEKFEELCKQVEFKKEELSVIQSKTSEGMYKEDLFELKKAISKQYS